MVKSLQLEFLELIVLWSDLYLNLFTNLKKKYLIEFLFIQVKPKIVNRKNQEIENIFQTKYGALKVMDLVGKHFGSKITLTKGYAHVLYPTPELWTITLPHRTQILYTPDISMVS